MTKYTITYGRKVQVKQYEPLHIELTQEFDAEEWLRDDAFNTLAFTVDRWIEEQLRRLGAP